MTVGDINSNARGSGARYNDGKVPLELLPLEVLAEGLWRDGFNESQQAAHDALKSLGAWQRTGAVGHLYEALNAIGYPWDEIAWVLNHGRKKYAEWNWLKGMAWSIPTGCAARHLRKVIEGERLDAESKLPHTGHAGCNLVFLITYQTAYPEGDDRPRMLEHAQVENVRTESEALTLLAAHPAPGPLPPIGPPIVITEPPELDE